MSPLKLQQPAPGLTVAKPVYNLHGLLLLKEGTILDEKNIVMLKSWGVNQIWIEEKECGEALQNDQPTEALKAKIEKTLAEKFSEESGNPIMVEIMRVANNILQQKIRITKGPHEISRLSANNRKY